MKKANLMVTAIVEGKGYDEASWWAFDEERRDVAGPCQTKRALQRELAEINRLVKSGKWAPRELYTGY